MILPVQMSFDRNTRREIARLEAEVPEDILVSKMFELLLECPPRTADIHTSKEKRYEK